MEPALLNGDRVFIQKRFGGLDRGDIVVFYFPKDPRESFIERIVGLPGEAIDIDEWGVVHINGSAISEAYIQPEANLKPRLMPEQKLKADEYFMMGDNRDASSDSRSFGPVARRLIYGKVLGRYWPISR